MDTKRSSFFVLTFVDSEAGNTMWAAETVSTSDAITRYTAGASITVVETETCVSFTIHVRSETTAFLAVDGVR